MVRDCFCTLGLGLAGLMLAATTLSSQKPPTPMEAARAHLDLFVVTDEGHPISDLRAEEVALRIDGRQRPVHAARWIGIESRPRSPHLLPPPFGTNERPNRARSLILVLDEYSFRPGNETVLREAVDRFLAELSADDRVAIVTVPYGGLKVDFTNNGEALSKAVRQVVGQASADETGSDFACRTRRTLESLTGLFESLEGGSGPTTVLFISSGLAAPRRDAAAMLGPGMCEITTDHFQQVGAAASGARAHVFLIQPENNTTQRPVTTVETIAGGGFEGSDNPLAGLEHLAGVTGGHRLQLLTPRESNLVRVLRETSGYYAVEFTPEPSDRNGLRHAVDLKVARTGATLRVRPTLVIARANVRLAKPPAPRDMLRQSRAFRDLPLRVVAYASRGDGGQLKIVTVGEVSEPNVQLKAASAGLFDSKGQLRAQWTAAAEELAGPSLIAGLVVPPGIYRLRLAGVDVQERGGTVDYDLDASLTQVGTLSVSGLVLGLSRSTGFRPALQFSREPAATGFLEIYGLSNTQVVVTMEIAASANGPATVTTPAVVAETREPDRRIATAALPIGGLPAGDYLVRAVIAVPGQPAARVVRTLRKIIG